jgi:D-tyrosyl-tRNA(Tyr) deacylase
MRAVIQRVSRAEVRVDGDVTGSIGQGYLILLGVEDGDGPDDLLYLRDKILQVRIWPDDLGKMNRNLLEAGGAALVVSQFTLLADCRKGRRPSFDRAAAPAQARALYEQMLDALRAAGLSVASGIFGADMKVELVNDGPVTLLLDSRRIF